LQSDESDDDEDMEENNRVGVTEDKPTSGKLCLYLLRKVFYLNNFILHD